MNVLEADTGNTILHYLSQTPEFGEPLVLEMMKCKSFARLGSCLGSDFVLFSFNLDGAKTNIRNSEGVCVDDLLTNFSELKENTAISWRNVDDPVLWDLGGYVAALEAAVEKRPNQTKTAGPEW
jgi:hypothetical protein